MNSVLLIMGCRLFSSLIIEEEEEGEWVLLSAYNLI
jgi:hypothetical protein